MYGSLAVGDFDPHTSDIDFIVVTETGLTESLILQLQEMHAAFDRSGAHWSGRIEAVYLPREALNHAAPTSARYPQVEKGTALFQAPLEIGWAFQRLALRTYGVVVCGPELAGWIDPVDPADMRRAAAAITGEWLDGSRRDPAWIAWVRVRSSQAFVVLTLCRLLYSLERGGIASKPAAACWAIETLGSHWEALIRRSLAGQHDGQEITNSELEETLAFLDYANERMLL